MPNTVPSEELEVVEAAALVRDLELCELLGGLLRHCFCECAQLEVALTGRAIVATYSLKADGIARSMTIPVIAARSSEIALIDAFARLETELAQLTGKRGAGRGVGRPDVTRGAFGNVVPFPRAPEPAGRALSGPIAERIAATSDLMSANLLKVAGLLEELTAAGTIDAGLLAELTARVQALNEAAARFARAAPGA